MSRLLEGDVGSGKTAVAATATYAVVTQRPEKDGKAQDFGNLQVAYMAPTEILATQHFESFIKYFQNLPIQVGLITGSGCRKFPSKLNPNGWTDISRNQLLKWVANGEIPILIGTHALIQKTVKFKNLAPWIAFSVMLIVSVILFFDDIKVQQKEVSININVNNRINICEPEDDFDLGEKKSFFR
jgi:RecG-like helicase